MMSKIVFFNHFHKGDLHTHKEFIRHLQFELPDVTFEYMHSNAEKLTAELNIPLVGSPSELNNKEPFYYDEDTETLFINTWVGCNWDVFCKHGGINMHTLYEQWEGIVEQVNEVFDANIKLNEEKESYLPRIKSDLLKIDKIEDYLLTADEGVRKVLICNNAPMSNQSFKSDMKEHILPFAEMYPDTHFICTNKFDTEGHENIKFTDDIIGPVDGGDLQEISYLSRNCDVIIGKNSGPYVFCETYDNYMDDTKTFISFNTKHPDYEDVQETMSNGLKLKCSYKAIPILSNDLTEKDHENIMAALNEALA
jgi:hypothetical protein